MRRSAAWYAGASLAFALLTAGSGPWGPSQAGLLAFLQLSVVVLIAAGSGRVLVRLLALSDVSGSQATLIGATLGLGILSLGTFALGALGLLRLGGAAAMLALLWLVGFTEMRPVLTSLNSNRSLLGERPLWAAAVLIPLSLVLWAAWVPPHQYDSLVYHLALPQDYLRAGRLVSEGPLVFSHFPQNAEMLFTLALLLKSDILAQMFMWLSTALSVWWVFEMGRREAPLAAVFLSCLLLTTHTAVMLLGSTTYVEPLVMLWTTAAVFSFMRWRQLSGGEPGQRSWLVLSAAFTGLALGTKYYAGIAAAALGGYLVLRFLRARGGTRRGHAADLGIFVALASALFAPWLVKNALTASDPVFPFLYRWFPSTGTGWTAENARGYFQVMTDYGHGPKAWSDLASLPMMLLTNSPRFGGGMDVLGGIGWETVFWALPLGIWAGWRNRVLRGLIFFCGVYLAAWFCTSVVLRFLVALAPLLCFLAGCGLHQLWSVLESKGARAALAAAVALLTATHLFLFLYVHALFGSPSFLLGLEDREAFLSRRLDYYPCARAAGARLGRNDRILIVGEQRGYYVERAHTATTVNAPNPYLRWANESKSPAELAERIRSEGYRHVLFVPREAKRLAPALGAFTEAGFSNWKGLEPAHLKPLFRGAACTLYEVAAPGS